jgi:Asp-tRNA(Asn)/Glu-tRNA(Gln) amidotransferase A subunit family amidase
LAASADERTRAIAVCVTRIAKHDPVVRAWVKVRPDREHLPGPLAGIPFGCKDIIETNGLPTEYGSPVYKGRVGTSDAAIVRLLRERGARLMGKTQTTAFAWKTPSPTRNPHHPDHTPGGSSSGSAAAVALGMVPFAIGTQTLGSVIRPASFCGVTGFKPSYGVLPVNGVLPCAPSLDTLGLFTHTAADMQALWDALQGAGRPSAAAFSLGVIEPLPDVDAEMASAFARTVERLRAGGATVRPIDLRDRLAAVAHAARVVLATEASREHGDRYKEHGDKLEDLADLVREGLAIPPAQYDQARRTIAEARAAIEQMLTETPVVLTPAALGPAPRGFSSTGDPAMNAPWTAMGAPAITIPMPGKGLPLGLQMTAPHGQDGLLLRTAVHVEQMLQGSG